MGFLPLDLLFTIYDIIWLFWLIWCSKKLSLKIECYNIEVPKYLLKLEFRTKFEITVSSVIVG